MTFLASLAALRKHISWRSMLRALACSALIDVALIVLVAFMFVKPVLNFNDQHVPSQDDDWQDNTSLMELARESILNHHELPMWNPNFGTGTPFIAEPKTFLFNPIASVPSLIWGVFDGPKISMFLSLALAGIGMYYLAGTIGISRPWRLWSGLMMVMPGAAAAEIFAGHFAYVVGLGVIPWMFALNIQALRRPGMLFGTLAGLANALLFFTGHTIFTVFAIPGLALTFAFVAGEQIIASAQLWRTTLLSLLGKALRIVGWTLGIAAIQLVPNMAALKSFAAPHYHLEGGETIFGTLNNFYSSDLEHLGPDPAYPLWGWWEYYFYIGIIPFVGLGLAVAALLRPASRFAVLWAATLFGLYLAWAAAPHTFFRWIYDAYQPLYQFRVPSRALNFATPFLILLGALGFNALTEWVRPYLTINARTRIALGRLLLASGVVVALIGISIYGLNDVYDTNRALLAGRDRYPDQREVARWLRDREAGTFYVQAPYLGQAVPPEFYRLDMPRLDARWEYGYAAPSPAPDMAAAIQPAAPYLIGVATDVVPNSTVIGTVGDWVVYHQQNTPPFASSIASAQPPTGPDYPWDFLSTPAEARIVSANVIEVRATPAGSQDRLLVLQSYNPGWRVEIDGKRSGRAANFGGYISTSALPGAHTYTFVFDPSSVRVGAAITTGTILGAILLAGWQYVKRRRARP